MDVINKKVIAPIENVFKSNIAPFLNNPAVKIVIVWIIIANIMNNFHSSFDKLPMFAQQIITSPISEAFSMFFLSYFIHGNFQLAFIGTSLYVLVFFIFDMIKEKFQLITKTPDIMIGCVNVTVADLLAKFNGNEHHLKEYMFSAGVPTNLTLTDINAPLIASYLVGNGKEFTESCKPPM